MLESLAFGLASIIYVNFLNELLFKNMQNHRIIVKTYFNVETCENH